jgi:hypothetical protein
MEIEELTENLELFDRFYSLFETIFPNDDIRESRTNLKKYLFLKKTDFYGRNQYHIFLALEDNKVLGFLVGDYYYIPQIAVIEYIGVDRNWRNANISNQLMDYFLAKITAENSSNEIKGIFLEAEIPPVRGETTENHLSYWNKKGFQALFMKYIQPPLESGKNSVNNLILVYKDLNFSGLSAERFDTLIKSYFKFAFSYTSPESLQEYTALHNWISNKQTVPVTSITSIERQGLACFENPISVNFVITMAPYMVREPFEVFRSLKDDNEKLEEKAKKLLESIKETILNTDLPARAHSNNWTRVIVPISLDISMGGEEILAGFREKEDFIQNMRFMREQLFSGDYLKKKISIKGVIKIEGAERVYSNNGSGGPISSPLILLDVNHKSVVSAGLIAEYSGLYGTYEMMNLMDIKDLRMKLKEDNKEYDVYTLVSALVKNVAALLGKTEIATTDGEKESNSTLFEPINVENYPLIITRTTNSIQEIKTHIYAIANTDNTFEYASTSYVDQIFNENISVIDDSYIRYGRKSSCVILRGNYYELLKPVTGYSEEIIIKLVRQSTGSRLDPEKTNFAIANEFVSEVGYLLGERFFLKQFGLMLREEIGGRFLQYNRRKKLEELAKIEAFFYANLEEFKSLSLFSYPELNLALNKARKIMGINEELDLRLKDLEVLSKEADILYRIRTNFNSNFTIMALVGVSLITLILDFFIPITFPLGQKFLVVFSVALAYILILSLVFYHPRLLKVRRFAGRFKEWAIGSK